MSDAIALVGRTRFETAILKRQLKCVEREKKFATLGLILPARHRVVAGLLPV